MVNKIDCKPYAETEWDKRCHSHKIFSKQVFTCAVTGQGLQDLEREVLELVGMDGIAAGGRKWTINQVSLYRISFLSLSLSLASKNLTFRMGRNQLAAGKAWYHVSMFGNII